MAKRSKRKPSVSAAVLLVLAVCAYLVLCTLQERYGYDFGLPTPDLPSLSELNLAPEGAGEEESPALPAYAPAPEADLVVHYLDVGQGDCTLITAPGATVLIDAGERDQGEKILRYLEGMGVERIDLLIATHPHADHIGGMDAVVEQLEIGQVLMPPLPDEIIPTTSTFTRLLEAIDAKGLSITLAQAGDRYDLGEGAALEILGPVATYDDLNNLSIACRLDYGSTSFLFTGDAEKAAENDLLQAEARLTATVLHLGHHGSSTSTAPAFLAAVAPRIAVISCGRDNSYGHPHREVMELLEEENIRVCRTDLDGPVLLYSDGESVGIQLGREAA